MLKNTIKISVCVLLSGCVIYAPTYVNKDRHTVVHYESSSSSVAANEIKETNEESVRVPEKPTQTSIKRTLANCDAFTLPREASRPKYLTEHDLVNAISDDEIDRILGLKIKELQTHIDKVHSRIEQAHVKWMEACEAKLR